MMPFRVCGDRRAPGEAWPAPGADKTRGRHGQLVALVTLLAFGASACRQQSLKEAAANPVPTNAVAIVAGHPIDAEALKDELRKAPRTPLEGALSRADKLAALDRLIMSQAIYAQARKAHFDQSPEIQARIQNLIITQYKEQMLGAKTAAVTDAEVEAYYRTHPDRFTSAAAVRGAGIFIFLSSKATEEKQREVRSRAEAVLHEAEQAATPEAFARVVVKYSEHQASRYRGGDLGWLERGQPGVEPELADALDCLRQPGEFAPLIKTARGYYVAKLLERREATLKPLVQVKDTIRHELARAKAEAAETQFALAMRANLNIETNLDLVDRIALPARPEPPLAPGVASAQAPDPPAGVDRTR